MMAGEPKKPCNIDLGDGVEMVFCFIPKGEFRMGSRYGRNNEQPVRRVIIPEDFWLAATPVTQQQFARFDEEHQSHFHGNNDHPVEQVDWRSATAFCQWLTASSLGSPEWRGWHADLPTEAQWEYACRAGTDTEYYTGDGEQALARVCWYRANSGGHTHEVWRSGQPAENFKQPNAFGLYDMHGNVWEWCRDVWQEDAWRLRPDGLDGSMAEAAADSTAQDPARVMRGGAVLNYPGYCRSAYRYRFFPGFRNLNLGFRVGLFPGPSCPGSS